MDRKQQNGSFEYDDLDLFILKQLTQHNHTSYSKIASEYGVSAGTINVRLEKMRNEGVIEKSKINIIYSKIGYTVTCFMGIILENARDYAVVIEDLKRVPEVIEAHYTTGQYNIFIKIIAKDIQHLHSLLSGKIQSIHNIKSTETLISLDNAIARDLIPE